MKKFVAWLLASVVSVPVIAQAPTVQSEFDTASAALKAGDWAGALSTYDELAKRLSRNPRSRAIVYVRKGEALFHLGRDDEAATAIKAGLADLPEADASLREDRYLALLRLGDIDMRGFDYATATVRYAEAERFADTPHNKIRAIAAKVQTGIFVDAEGALADIDRAAAIATTLPADKAANARLNVLRGRVLLNLKRYKEAQALFYNAVKDLGGLTMRVTQDDIAARSDYAIAAMLAGDAEQARKYLAYTGAGRLPNDGFETGVEMEAPPCGAKGLQPDDVAVVEFSIRDDGSVGFARPIYSSRQGVTAIEFAHAVSDWSWTPERVKKISPFFRSLTRIEMRCSTASARPSVPGLLEPALESWLAERGVQPLGIAAGPDARRLALLKAELVRREASAGAQSVELLPVLIELANSSVVPADVAAGHSRRALMIAEALKAPPAVHLLFAATHWQTEASSRRSRTDYAHALEQAVTMPAFSSDPLARAAVRLMLVDALRGRQPQKSTSLLSQIVDDQALAGNDPFRVGALIRLASAQYRDGNVDAARATFERSGLSSSQCALADAPPRMRSGTISSDDFPREAMTWGFSGWTEIQFDIAADGKTLNRRALIAYPPFVFGDVTAGYIKRFQFEPSFRPEASLGCGGKTQRVTYRSGR